MRLKIQYVAPADLTPADYNPRTITPTARERMRAGIAEFGQVMPIVARRDDGMIIGGHQRLECAIALGEAKVPVVYLDDLSDDRAAALNVLLNNPKAQGEWDVPKLAEVIGTLDAEGFDATLTGFDTAELEELVAWAPPAAPAAKPDAGARKAAEGFSDEALEALQLLAGYGTAIDRDRPSLPMRWYKRHGLLKGAVLDYGCGRDKHQYGRFDPAYHPDYDLLLQRWDVVTCNFVLNVIPLEHNRHELSLAIRSLLAGSQGKALFAVWQKEEEDTESVHGYQCGWDADQWERFFAFHWSAVERLGAAGFGGWRCSC